MKNSKTAIVLGGAISHIALVKKLKERNFYVILIDYYENPPAKIYADKHIIESATDNSKVLEIAVKYNAELIINTCLDLLVYTASAVSEKLNLPILFNSKTAKLVTDKELMKKRFVDYQIPTSDYVVIDSPSSLDSLQIDLKFPLIIKPVDATGSIGITKVKNREEIGQYIDFAFNASKSKRVIIEEFFEGEELNIYCFIEKKNLQIVMINKKINGSHNNTDVFIGSVSLKSLPKNVVEIIEEVALKTINAFDIDNGPLLIQALINKNEINVIEIACRIGGGLGYNTIELNTQFDILDATIALYFNEKRETEIHKTDFISATCILYASKGLFQRITGFETLSSNGIIEDFLVYKMCGTEIPDGLTSKNRIGAFIVKSSDLDGLNNKITKALDTIKVLDSNNSDILIRDLYNSKITL